jgi:Tfp pilus assembly protein PilX
MTGIAMRYTPNSQAAKFHLPPERRQQGMVLIFALIALLILGLGAVGLIRSFDTSTVVSVNLGFKRDLTNEGQLAIAQAKEWFIDTTKLGNDTVQQSDNTTYNYYATVQATNQFGIPTALLNSSPSALQLPSSSSYTPGIQTGVTVYMMIDRLCAPGTTAQSTAACMLGLTPGQRAACAAWPPLPQSPGPPPCPAAPVFRITVRVDGPHNTHTFLQQTITTGT